MSLTYLASLVQFFVVMGLVTQAEAAIINEFITVTIAFVLMLLGIYGRYRIGGITLLGTRK